MKKFFYDLETTGTEYYKHSIHQMAGIIEIDDVVVERFNFNIRPHEKAEIVPEALAVAFKGMPFETAKATIMSYPTIEETYALFIKMLEKYVNRYDKKDRFYTVGFRNGSFDDKFLSMFFHFNNDPFFASWFWSDYQDVCSLASVYLEHRRKELPSFKLFRVAKELGLQVDDSRLHEGGYDIEITRNIYRIVTGREMAPNDPLF